jgi:hypothetical protein
MLWLDGHADADDASLHASCMGLMCNLQGTVQAGPAMLQLSGLAKLATHTSDLMASDLISWQHCLWQEHKAAHCAQPGLTMLQHHITLHASLNQEWETPFRSQREALLGLTIL